MGNQVEGFDEAGQNVVVIEDLVSTGKSSLLAVDAFESSWVGNKRTSCFIHLWI